MSDFGSLYRESIFLNMVWYSIIHVLSIYQWESVFLNLAENIANVRIFYFSSKYKRWLSEFGSTYRESVFLNSTVNIEKSPGSLGSSSLDELIEIQKGVSEKEFSIDEAERLYSAWKERNRSFKMSMKDRQRGLEEMRSTYAGVIYQAKARGERQSLFERIKSTFGGRKSSREDIYQPMIKVFDNFFIFPLCMFKLHAFKIKLIIAKITTTVLLCSVGCYGI